MIDRLFADAARAHASAIAIVDGEERITYTELALRRDRVVGLLYRMGVGAGDRVGISLTNGWEFAASFLAACCIRADWVAFNPGWKAPEIEWLARRLPLRVLITSTSLVTAWQSLDRVRPEVLLVDEFRDGDTVGATAGSERDAVVNYITSGSTGHPRIAPRRHSQIASGVQDTAVALRLRPGLRWLSVVPFHHGHGLNTLLLQPLTSGGTMVVMREFNPALFEEVIARERIQVISCSPFYYAMLAERGARAESLASVEICLSGGAPMSPELTRTCREQLGLRVRQYYGASETGAVAFTSVEDAGRHDAPMWPAPGMDVRIVDEAGVPVGPGVTGRVEIRGPGVFEGYLGEDELNAKVLRDGYYLTGDLGCMESAGGFALRGRATAVINVGGNKVDPVEVENAIRELPTVENCQVRGFRDERQGEIVEAIVAVRPGFELSREAVVAHCRRMLAEYKVPRRIELVDAIAFDAAGKRLVSWRA